MKSISTRPESIESRKDFGNWEIDSIAEGKGRNKHTLLALAERKMRFVIIRKLPDG